MNLGFGEYLTISNCIEMPFDKQKLIDLLKSIESNIENIDSIIFFNDQTNKINYELVWEGLETFRKDIFDYNDIYIYPLSSIDIKFKDGIIGRLLVNFLDELSYEIAFVTNYTEVFEECDNSWLRRINAERIEQLAFQIFDSLKPVYGCIGVELNIHGLKELKLNKSLLPIEKVYYSNKICDFYKVLSLNNFRYYKKLIDGIYLRNSVIDDYLYNG